MFWRPSPHAKPRACAKVPAVQLDDRRQARTSLLSKAVCDRATVPAVQLARIGLVGRSLSAIETLDDRRQARNLACIESQPAIAPRRRLLNWSHRPAALSAPDPNPSRVDGRGGISGGNLAC